MVVKFEYGKTNYQWALELEKRFCQYFDMVIQSGPTYFNYILINPIITQNLPHMVKYSSTICLEKCFSRFIQSIFYVGVGNLMMPRHHLWKAKMAYKSTTYGKSKKYRAIGKIWEEGYGVVSVLCASPVSYEEASTRKALMMDAVGHSHCGLTNTVCGQYYGETFYWSCGEKIVLGSLFLAEVFNQLLLDGEKMIFPQDV